MISKLLLVSLSISIASWGTTCTSRLKELRNISGSDFDPPSVGNIEVISGEDVNLWSIVGANRPDAVSKVQLEIRPDQPVVIGRQEGGRPPYLDPNYIATQLVPGGGRVVKGGQTDKRVSRAHFMLKHSASGIILVNGVPFTEGGIRSPKNGTVLLSPEHRPLNPGEEYLVKSGESAKIRLPNGTVLLLNAE